MKLRFRFLQKIILIFFLTISLHSKGWSQPGQDQDADQSGADGESSTNGFGDPGTDPDLPIDSNVFILVAAGVGYGLKTIYDSKRRKNISQKAIIS